jgi:4-hydroxythreonine-4-phosphate dehydrogenase
MKLAVTCGDINGIGLEVFFKALEKFLGESDFVNDIEFTLAIEKNILLNYSNLIRKRLIIKNDHFIFKGRKFNYINTTTTSNIHYGRVDKNAGAIAAESIKMMTKMTMEGKFDALLTLPISKEAIYKAGWEFPGHTEYLASETKVKNPLMLICTNAIRVLPLTIHIPLKDVSKNITQEKIVEYAQKLNQSLIKDFSEKYPRIAILSLNPHSGENGNLGKEEKDVIIPAIRNLKHMDIDVRGPFAADGFFAHGEYLRYDAIISMYHDQGLIPVKLLAMGGGTNYTAGLPIIRISPDHGTAFNIAGKGIASEMSTYNAIEQAYKIYRNRLKNSKSE